MKNKYKISKSNLDRMIIEAVMAAKKNGLEICGLLIFNGYFIELVKVRNKIKRGGGFEFYVNDIRFLQKATKKIDHEIIGTFHSHPEYIAKPSESDIYNALDDSFMLIIDTVDQEVNLWHIKNLKKKRIQFELI